MPARDNQQTPGAAAARGGLAAAGCGSQGARPAIGVWAKLLGTTDENGKKVVEVSLFSWWRNLWRSLTSSQSSRHEARPEGSLSTIEFPAYGSGSTPAPGAGSGRALQLRFGFLSTIGNVREHNEDSVYVPPRNPVVFTQPPASPELPGLFLVADGMGGQLAGEQASSMAVEHIPRDLFNRLANDPDPDDKLTRRAIRDAVASANQEILSLASLETEFSNMGTTLVLALFQKERAYITGLGDSPAYRLREGRLERLTRDHSLARALEEAGTISSEEVDTHKFKNVLYLYLGSKDARTGPEEVRVLDLRPGDRFLLATDGLTGVVSDERLAQVLASYSEPQEAAKVLIDEALQNFSKDNITCVVVHVEAA